MPDGAPSEPTPAEYDWDAHDWGIPKAALLAQVRRYNSASDSAMIATAFDYARHMHREQTRKSGEPYFIHVVAVAELVAGLRLDDAAVVAALLHDTVEDTDSTENELASVFTPEIARLVNGVTKLTKLELSSKETQQAENLQKFVLAISEDVRVLLIKLCDRLHNLRTLHHVPSEEKRLNKALETLEIYAPLARRIGVQRICAELEDWAFRHYRPTVYESISLRLAELRQQRARSISSATRLITDQLQIAGIKARIYGREKRPYSIWRKLEAKGITGFDEMSDLFAFRIVTQTVDQCYRALGVAHANFRSVPDRFKDHISVPKPNGYQSLHTTVTGPDNVRIELQIRTESMERIAEDGVAAHWRYKSGKYGFDATSAALTGFDPLKRLEPLREILEHGGDPNEFLEHAKLEMFADQVFAFTPNGRVVTLPQGATPIDFAYAVHTAVGDTCVGAKINGSEVPLRTVVRNGDSVEIIRGAVPAPPPDWEAHARTGRARAGVRRLIRKRERLENEKIGRKVALQAVQAEIPSLTQPDFTQALERLKFKSLDDLFFAIGSGAVTTRELLEAMFPGRELARLDTTAEKPLISGRQTALYVDGDGLTEGVSLHRAKCCSPLPGDRIVGVLTPPRGMLIHTIDCDVLAKVEERRWIDLHWKKSASTDGVWVGRVLLTVRHAPGVLAELSGAVSQSKGNITNVKTLRRSLTTFDMIFDVEVFDNRQLSSIIAALKACPSVITAERAHDPDQETKASV